MIIAATSIAILMYVWALYHANRASNLEVQCEELRYQLDDATRERDQLRHTNGCLIRENTTLSVDLYNTEQEAAAYRSHYRATQVTQRDYPQTFYGFSRN